MAYRLKALPLHTIISNNTFKVTICDLKNKDRNMADNIEHQDKGQKRQKDEVTPHHPILSLLVNV